MKPYISQPKGSMSCGAYSIAYYLWETNKAQHINDRTFVDNIYKEIQVGPNNMGIHEACSNPEKMSMKLSDTWYSNSYICILPNSPLIQLANNLTPEIEILSNDLEQERLSAWNTPNWRNYIEQRKKIALDSRNIRRMCSIYDEIEG